MREEVHLQTNRISFFVLLALIVIFSIFDSDMLNFFLIPSCSTPPYGRYIHISVDDSNSIFEDLTVNEKNYSSIFDQPKLHFIKELHDRYGMAVSFYVFYSWDTDSDRFCLPDATDAFRDEFTENADWLRFGFHAKDAGAYEEIDAPGELEYYNKTIEELLRITGSHDCIDNFVRLDRYFGTDEMIKLLSDANEGVKGLLISDNRERQSYALSDEDIHKVYESDWLTDENGICYTPTDIRLENINGTFDFNQKISSVAEQRDIVIFTHEWILDDSNVRKYMEQICLFGQKNGLQFGFPEDHLR